MNYELRKQEKMADAQKKLQESLAKKDPLTERKEAEAAAAATEIDPPVNPTIEEMDTDPVKPE